jgi:TIR domain
MTFKAFISYSHTADYRFAEALHTALQRFAAPRTGLRIFRDTSNLSASTQLWPSIERALDESEFFLLIASMGLAGDPASARSMRCRGLILVLVSGNVMWDDQHDKVVRFEGVGPRSENAGVIR